MKIKNFEIHRPVLLSEVIEILNPRQGGVYVDATVNGGGHARAILEKIGLNGHVIGIDWDPVLVGNLSKEIERRGWKRSFTVVCGNYRNLESLVPKEFYQKIDGILFDLGYSSYHVDVSGRGFSLKKDEELDMRYNIHDTNLTAKTIVNGWTEAAIADLLRTYGEERAGKRIAKAIVEYRKRRPIETAAELANVILRVLPRRGRIHPATQTFQALRIVVNRELENLTEGLDRAARMVQTGGVVLAITFHSLEDRIVKHLFRGLEHTGAFQSITKKPVVPSRREVVENPRARSAKLRAIQKRL